jgi:hypothetical protein
VGATVRGLGAFLLAQAGARARASRIAAKRRGYVTREFLGPGRRGAGRRWG